MTDENTVGSTTVNLLLWSELYMIDYSGFIVKERKSF
jgi:hypothetical protein